MEMQRKQKKKCVYQYPEEKCNLKSILEKNEVNQEEDNVGAMKPKVIISWLNNQFTFNG